MLAMTGIVYERRGGEEDSEGAIDYTFIHICLHFLAYTEWLVCVCVYSPIGSSRYYPLSCTKLDQMID